MDDRLRTGSALATTPSATYAAAVIGLAIFLSLLILFPEPILRYTARIALEQTAQGDAQLATQTLQRNWEGAQRLAEQTLESNSPAAAVYESNGEPRADVRWKLAGSRQVTALVECRARRAGDALELCRQIAERMVAGQPEQVAPQAEEREALRADVARRMAVARDAEAALADEWSALEREQVAQSISSLQKQTTKPAAPTFDSTTIGEVASNGDFAVVREQVTAQLQTLAGKRQDLLLTRTESHPLVREIALQIADLQAYLAKLPGAPLTLIESPNVEAVEPAQLAVLQQRFEDLAQRRREARQRRDILASDAERLAQPAPVIRFSTKIIAPAEVISREGGNPSAFRFTAMFGCSCLAGALAFFTARNSQSTSVFKRPEQVKQVLGLKVVPLGRLPHVRGTRTPKPAARELEWLRSSVFSAELLLVVLALSFLYAYGSQSQISQTVTNDPLGVVAEAFDRVGESTVRR